MNERAVQQDVLHTLDYAHIHDDWVNPLADALAGATVEEAIWRPAPNARCIGEMVLHMTAWTNDVVQWLQTGTLSKPANDWPALPDPMDEAQWHAAQKRLWDALTTLREQLTAIAPADLLGRTDPNGTLLLHVLCRCIHNAYHIGQITKLREFYAGRGTAHGTPG